MKLLLLFYVFVKSILWLLTGIFFGASTFILVFASKILYDQPIHLSTLITYDYIMFLCVCLMSGAAADFVCSPHRVWGNRLAPLLVCIVFLSLLCFVFNPMVHTQPNEKILKIMTIAYSIITVCFCSCIKSVLFYEESQGLDKVKF